jgi:hypothetical protein
MAFLESAADCDSLFQWVDFKTTSPGASVSSALPGISVTIVEAH